jgi:hypothetical protein
MSVCRTDRVEHLRRQLAVNSNTSAQDMESIQTVELLGEGTFGKVYKGLWRGSTVAVSDAPPPQKPGAATVTWTSIQRSFCHTQI